MTVKQNLPFKKSFQGGERTKMGLFKNWLGGKWKEDVEKALDDAEKEDLEVSGLEEKWLQRRREEMVGDGKGQGQGPGVEVEGGKEEEEEWKGTEGEEEKEREGEEKEEKDEDVSEDGLISSLKKEEERVEETEMEMVLKKETEEVGDVSAGEVLELGRTVLHEIAGERK
jgi:hypothetical protein